MRAPRNTPSDQGTSVSRLLVLGLATMLLVWLLCKLGIVDLTQLSQLRGCEGRKRLQIKLAS